MPYPSPLTYPSPSLYPGFGGSDSELMIALGDLVLGALDEFGVRWTVSRFDGWGSTAPTLELSQRARGHGATASESFYTARIMTIEGQIQAPSNAARLDAEERLAAAVKLDEFPMIVAYPDRTRNVMVQRKGEVLPTELTPVIASYSVLVSAKDPRKYGDLITASTLLPFSSGGLVRPSTWPRTWTGVSGTGVVRVRNEGNTQAPVWLRIDGPIPAGGWTVTHVGKKQSLTFSTALALEAGEFVTVDMDRREILAQGQSARAGYVTSRGWFSLDPGDNDIAFSAQNYSSTATLTVSTKPSWS